MNEFSTDWSPKLVPSYDHFSQNHVAQTMEKSNDYGYLSSYVSLFQETFLLNSPPCCLYYHFSGFFSTQTLKTRSNQVQVDLFPLLLNQNIERDVPAVGTTRTHTCLTSASILAVASAAVLEVANNRDAGEKAENQSEKCFGPPPERHKAKECRAQTRNVSANLYAARSDTGGPCSFVQDRCVHPGTCCEIKLTAGQAENRK
ncbi:hypothetical protein Y032_0643g1060 [Ancylostoma ceylanicum]|uniref:Uncharacterized protein n=1 Tax=Ancylostoma ceylanicum TaxID=53326 RepID=A0A016WJ93_9BILA|nr:hypothetical protein Y032_0643g1060 [Ancylostoma ceylanicum]